MSLPLARWSSADPSGHHQSDGPGPQLDVVLLHPSGHLPCHQLRLDASDLVVSQAKPSFAVELKDLAYSLKIT